MGYIGLKQRGWFGSCKCLISSTDSVVIEWPRREQSGCPGNVPCLAREGERVSFSGRLGTRCASTRWPARSGRRGGA
jgi:hypothetical protein